MHLSRQGFSISIHRILRIKWSHTLRHLINQYPQTPIIHRPIMSLAQNHLRGQIIRRPAESIRLPILNHLGQPKVHNLDISRIVQHEILRFEIAIGHLTLVHVRKRRQHAGRVEHAPILREFVLKVQQLTELAAAQCLHEKILALDVLHDVVTSGDEGMDEGFHNVFLALDFLLLFLLLDFLFGYAFEGVVEVLLGGRGAVPSYELDEAVGAHAKGALDIEVILNELWTTRMDLTAINLPLRFPHPPSSLITIIPILITSIHQRFQISQHPHKVLTDQIHALDLLTAPRTGHARRRTNIAVKQRLLPEERPGFEGDDGMGLGFFAHVNIDGAGGDHVEGVAHVALADDDLTLGKFLELGGHGNGVKFVGFENFDQFFIVDFDLLQKHQLHIQHLPLMPRNNHPKRPTIHKPHIHILPRLHRRRPRTTVQQRNLPESHPRMQRPLKLRGLVHAHAPVAQHVKSVPVIPLPYHYRSFLTMRRRERVDEILQFLRGTRPE
mmetsp:Transcript_37028/g.78180  ORF Transcript_37028/g.78180 Transcript_37028/m.78180 type:complete len:497 (+) Transcript_37028:760-2250(+)